MTSSATTSTASSFATHSPATAAAAMAATTAGAAAAAAPAKKRNRAILSCLVCHERRVKCDRQLPCAPCRRYGAVCTYAAPPSTSTKRKKAAGGLLRADERDEEEEDEQGEARTSTKDKPFRGFMQQFEEQFASQEEQEQEERDERGKERSTAATTHGDESTAYTPCDVARMQACWKRLPSQKVCEELIGFYLSNVDYMYGAAEAGRDSLSAWMRGLMDRFQPGTAQICPLLLNHDDASRMAFVATTMLAAVQMLDPHRAVLSLVDSDPTSNLFGAAAAPDKSSTRALLESTALALLDLAIEADEASPLQVRINLILLHYFKNEGRSATPTAKMLVRRNAQVVRACKLHLDPPLDSPELESLRSLFYTYYIYDRYSSVNFGALPAIADHEITTQPPVPEHFSSATNVGLGASPKIRFAKIAGDMASAIYRAQLDDATIDRLDAELVECADNLPCAYALSSTNDVEASQSGVMQVQRHALWISYHSARAMLHRTRFFSRNATPSAAEEKSRALCIESAIEMIKAQQSVRKRTGMAVELYSRSFLASYLTLEPATTLVVSALTEVAKTPGNAALPHTVDVYLAWARRGLLCLETLPSDLDLASRSAHLLSRILKKRSIKP
ncbi:hypothetical protein IE81DRAFT_23965 [Ceraceosorus guamensis]|uniref:Zn(2)-C6 fungal-type domain-containing protein n=1 Tax=Ceraceosorus guamensis TaxID=1522189 RepID=A0A316VQI3_9BASI|nr:hypothetical protein IE81DRAFT_23965 [Ceraceosorus guamensis]PWN39504.1 hypothetical protein IE81DRAFT_23965 [Ceraceosorus guamensis]